MPNQEIENINNSTLEEENVDDPAPIASCSTAGIKKRAPKRKLVESSDDSSSSESSYSESSANEDESSTSDSDENQNESVNSKPDDNLSDQPYKVNDYVIVYYTENGNHHLGQITKTSVDGAKVRCLEKYGRFG
ncbi:hypothetical protein V9T40_008827 [Parthenolecanium corni]|uniref:Uncharacterized protein n=1 Tax=Parthenolecanium corni TaxID=536013 RepID=A0AAN9Y6Z3_9HEMI